MKIKCVGPWKVPAKSVKAIQIIKDSRIPRVSLDSPMADQEIIDRIIQAKEIWVVKQVPEIIRANSQVASPINKTNLLILVAKVVTAAPVARHASLSF